MIRAGAWPLICARRGNAKVWVTYVTNVLLLGCGIAGLWVFSQFWLHGHIVVGEPALTIRILETILFGAITIFALCNLIRALLKGSR